MFPCLLHRGAMMPQRLGDGQLRVIPLVEPEEGAPLLKRQLRVIVFHKPKPWQGLGHCESRWLVCFVFFRLIVLLVALGKFPVRINVDLVLFPVLGVLRFVEDGDSLVTDLFHFF